MAAEENGDFGGSQQDNQTTVEGSVTSTRLSGADGFTGSSSAGDETAQSMDASAIEGELRPTPRHISQDELKQLRRMYFTVRHDRVEECGHKLDRMNEPRMNCEFCWYAWLDSHPDLVETADQAYIKHGYRFLDKLRGMKFRKMFCRFMATKLKLQQEQELLNGQQGEVGSDSGSQQEVGQGERQSDVSEI